MELESEGGDGGEGGGEEAAEGAVVAGRWRWEVCFTQSTKGTEGGVPHRAAADEGMASRQAAKDAKGLCRRRARSDPHLAVRR